MTFEKIDLDTDGSARLHTQASMLDCTIHAHDQISAVKKSWLYVNTNQICSPDDPHWSMIAAENNIEIFYLPDAGSLLEWINDPFAQTYDVINIDIWALRNTAGLDAQQVILAMSNKLIMQDTSTDIVLTANFDFDQFADHTLVQRLINTPGVVSLTSKGASTTLKEKRQSFESISLGKFYIPARRKNILQVPATHLVKKQITKEINKLPETHTKHLVYVIPTAIPDQIPLDDCRQLEVDLPLKLTPAATLEQIFPMLSDPEFVVDYLVIEVEHFYNNKNNDVFELISTLKTLASMPMKNGGLCRDIKIMVMIGEDTPLKTIREIQNFSRIDYLILRVSRKFTYQMVLEKWKNILSGTQPRVHNEILELLGHNQRSKKLTKDISLTPRQGQILTMITSRGASNKIIARTLNITESAVKLHVTNILKKYGVRNRTQLAVFSQEKT